MAHGNRPIKSGSSIMWGKNLNARTNLIVRVRKYKNEKNN